MTNRTVSAGRTPRITIEHVAGDLSVVGWEGEDLLIKTKDDGSHLSQDEDRVLVSSTGDLAIRAPRSAALLIQMVAGDLAIRGINGDIRIIQIQGDASLRDVNNVSIDLIQSDVSLRAVRGNVIVKNISGDASIRDIQGNIELESIADDLALRDVRGNLNANVGGDVVMYLDPQPLDEYSIHAGDDMMLILPPNANVSLDMNGDQIYIDWPGIPYEDEATSRSIILGSGESKIHISAGGEVRISSQEKAQQAPEEFGNFAGMMFDWGDFGKQLGARIGERVKKATRRAPYEAARAAHSAEAKIRGKSSRSRMNWSGWEWSNDPNLNAQSEQREPISEDERLVILKMLAERKITASEAERLLAALEGNS